MHFGFALELPGIDLWNIDLFDTHLDLLSPDKYTGIPSKYIFWLHKIFKTSSRHVFKTSSRHVFEMSSRHVFKTCLQDMSSRRPQDVFSVTIFCFPRSLKDIFKTSSRRLARCPQDVLKMSSRRLWRHKIVTLKTCWRQLQDQQMFAGTFLIGSKYLYFSYKLHASFWNLLIFIFVKFS